MARKEVKGPISDETLNVTNHNFKELYEAPDRIEGLADEAVKRSKTAIDTAGNSKEQSQRAEDKAKSIQSQFDAVVGRETDSDSMSRQAAVDTKGNDKGNLKKRLDDDYNEVTTKLKETVDKIPNIANATSILKILNPYGNYQNIHPKVLHFPDGLFGYKWWMAYTPYPGGNTKQENPCLTVSNNGLDWEVPEGFENEALEEWNGVNGAYNNDTHLVYRSDLDRLEVWWRFADSNNDEVNLYRRTSTDGVNWEPKQTMFTGHRVGDDHLSPAIVFEDNKYKMLSVNTVKGERILSYSESESGNNWGERTEAITDWGTLTPWHIDFINEGDKYTVALQAWDIGETNNTASIYHLETEDLIHFTSPRKIIGPTSLPNSFDNAGIYRSSIVKVGKTYYLFYSGINKSSQRAIALSYGENIFALKGFTIDLENITQLTVKNGNLAVNLEQSPDINNVLAIKQSSNNARHGGIKVGGLQFANGLTEGVVPEPGQIRYSTSQDRHERYDADKLDWVDLVPNSKKIVFAEKSTEQNLKNDDFITVRFENERFNDGSFIDSKLVKIPVGSNYRFEVGLQLTGLQAGDAIEVYVRRDTTNLRTLARQSVNPDSSGTHFIHATGVLNLLANYEMSIGIKYIGGSSSAKISSAYTQNYLFVEIV